MTTSTELLRCCDCHELKPTSAFYRRSGCPGKFNGVCRPCLALRCRLQRARHMLTHGSSMTAEYRRRAPLHYASTLLTAAEKKLAAGDLVRAGKYLTDASNLLLKVTQDG